MIHRTLAIAISLFVIIPALAFSAKVGSMREPGVDFDAFTTFAFAERSDRKIPKPGSELDTVVRRVATQELYKKGLRPVREGETPDLILTYEAFLSLEGDLPSDPRFKTRWIYYFDGPGSDAPAVPRPKGYFSLELRDPGSNEILWAGWGTEKARDQSQFIDKVEKMIKKLVRYYPST